VESFRKGQARSKLFTGDYWMYHLFSTIHVSVPTLKQSQPGEEQKDHFIREKPLVSFFNPVTKVKCFHKSEGLCSYGLTPE